MTSPTKGLADSTSRSQSSQIGRPQSSTPGSSPTPGDAKLTQPLLPAATSGGMDGDLNPHLSSPAYAAAASAPLQYSGWLYKYAVGTSAVFGRKNWQLRFFVSNQESISYYSSEPFDTPRRVIRWRDVTHVYDFLNSGMHKQASDPERFYFGMRFYGIVGSSEEHVLLLRTDNPAERTSWVAHLIAVHSKLNNMSITSFGVVPSVANLHTLMGNYNNNNSSSSGGGGGPESPGSADGAIERRQAGGRGWLVEALATPLRNLVSLKKKRFQQDGFDLDLAYIDEDIIAMGFPSVGKDAIVRNPMDQVIKFLEERHGNRYHVFNLCSERFYPPSAFGGKFDRFPFDDHNAPPLELFLPFCRRAAEVLRRPPNAEGKGWAIAIHCKAGKGRTGAMIVALLMYLGRCANDKEALAYFAKKRTKDEKGVQIPSQIRYCEYFYRIRSYFNDQVPPPIKVVLKTLILSNIPRFDSDGGADPFVLVQARRETHGHRPLGTNEGNVHNPNVTLLDTRTACPAKHVIGIENYPVDIGATVSGDIRIVLLDQDGFGKDELMAAFWINTSFLPLPDKKSGGGGNGNEAQLLLNKKELDFAVKEKVRIDPNFHVVLKYEFVR